MRPIGYREEKVTRAAISYAKVGERDMITALAHLRGAPDQNAARIVREGIRRAARVRGIVLPRVAVCRDACCYKAPDSTCDDSPFRPSLQAMNIDIDLLASAIEASGLSARRFAMEVLGVDERSVRKWLAGDREVPGTVAIVARAIIRRPELAAELVDANRHRITGD